MSTTTTELRNRFDKRAEPKTTEELLIEKLDGFLSSIELRLERFDQYFKVMGREAIDKTIESKTPDADKSRSRSSSSASISSLKTFSVSNLNRVHEQLRVVKDHVLKTSVTNLDYLYKILDDKYNDLFNQDAAEAERAVDAPPSREILLTKIITTIHYFEQKLADVDQLIKSRTPQATADYERDARFSQFRFFNFNKALKDAQKGYLHYYQLPLGWRENRYIIYGYRFELGHMSMLKLMFHFNHNETGNIWTHMVGALAMVYLALVHYPATAAYAKGTWGDKVVMYAFFAAALECLVSSVLWHTYLCFAQLRVRNNFACVDYTGITVLITCLVILAEYCALYHYPTLLTYFVGLSALAGVSGFLFNWLPYFDGPECRPFRIGFYVCLALLGATTFLCMWWYEGLVYAVRFYAPLAFKSFLWYWVGVVFYGGLIPERWRYDVLVDEDDTCTHSHGAGDVLTGHVEHCGEEELEELEREWTHAPHDSPRHSHDSLHDAPDSAGGDVGDARHREILDKHFRAQPTTTPYRNDFMLLWWVDYAFSSHNLWHVFVVFGVVGHYFSIVGMMESLHQ